MRVPVFDVEGFGGGFGLGRVRVCRLEKRPPRTVGRFWEGLRWP